MKKFTLIELLVVMAILGILVSILLPSLTKARATAKAGVCSSNLRQLGLGVEMYESDYSKTPPAILVFADSSHITWLAQIAKYFESTNTSLSTMAPFNCPANEFQAYYTSYGWGRRYESYGGNGWNGVRLNSATPPGPPSRALGIMSSSIESPADLYLAADAVYYRFANQDGGNHPDCGSGEGAGYPCMIKYNAGDKNHGYLRYDHLKKLNMLYADKHVSREKQVVTKTNSSVNWYAKP